MKSRNFFSNDTKHSQNILLNFIPNLRLNIKMKLMQFWKTVDELIKAIFFPQQQK